jgi:uncharacterized protein
MTGYNGQSAATAVRGPASMDGACSCLQFAGNDLKLDGRSQADQHAGRTPRKEGTMTQPQPHSGRMDDANVQARGLRRRAAARGCAWALGAMIAACGASGCRWRRTEPRPTAPPSHVEMTVGGLYSVGNGGSAVILATPTDPRVVPIFIGGTEALSIHLRLEHQRYQRPLTHDLLDNVVRELGGELVKVQVDELKDNVFIGTVFVRDGGRIAPLDARPSDAIALAIGADVPIFVARKVVSAAGVRKEDFERSHGAGADRQRDPEGPDPLSL